MKNKEKNKVYLIFNYLIGFALFYNCNSMWSTGEYSSKLNLIISIILVIGIYGCISFNVNIINKNYIKTGIICSILFLIYSLIYLNNSNNSGNIKLEVVLIIIVFSFIWLFYLDYKKQSIPYALICYRNIIFVVGIVSLFFWLFGSTLHLIKASGVYSSNWGAFNGNFNLVPNYYNIYFEPQSINTQWGEFVRNSAIFSEAPMASLNFSIALIINKFDKNKIIEFILSLCILTTFSTTGYFVLIVYFFIKLYQKIKFNYNIKMIIIPIVLFLGGFMILYLMNQKLQYGTDSASIRFNDYLVGFMAWRPHPIFGTGIKNSDYIISFMDNWRSYNVGLSNSFAEVMANGGLYLTIGYIGCFVYGIINNLKTKNFNKLFIIVFTLYLFMTTIFTYNYILLLLLVWFIIQTPKSNKNCCNMN